MLVSMVNNDTILSLNTYPVLYVSSSNYTVFRLEVYLYLVEL
jgi:hypothetical protein